MGICRACSLFSVNWFCMFSHPLVPAPSLQPQEGTVALCNSSLRRRRHPRGLFLGLLGEGVISQVTSRYEEKEGFRFVFEDRISLCNRTGCPGTHALDQAGLKLSSPGSVS